MPWDADVLSAVFSPGTCWRTLLYAQALLFARGSRVVADMPEEHCSKAAVSMSWLRAPEG